MPNRGRILTHFMHACFESSGEAVEETSNTCYAFFAFYACVVLERIWELENDAHVLV
jgi:hypothetical protein